MNNVKYGGCAREFILYNAIKRNEYSYIIFTVEPFFADAYLQLFVRVDVPLCAGRRAPLCG